MKQVVEYGASRLPNTQNPPRIPRMARSTSYLSPNYFLCHLVPPLLSYLPMVAGVQQNKFPLPHWMDILFHITLYLMQYRKQCGSCKNSPCTQTCFPVPSFISQAVTLLDRSTSIVSYNTELATLCIPVAYIRASNDDGSSLMIKDVYQISFCLDCATLISSYTHITFFTKLYWHKSVPQNG